MSQHLITVSSVSPAVMPSRCCTAPATWRCTTAAPHGFCAATKSLRSPAPSWCVNPFHTRPTSTRRWTAGPSWADTVWTWSSPTVMKSKEADFAVWHSQRDMVLKLFSSTYFIICFRMFCFLYCVIEILSLYIRVQSQIRQSSSSVCKNKTIWTGWIKGKVFSNDLSKGKSRTVLHFYCLLLIYKT